MNEGKRCASTPERTNDKQLQAEDVGESEESCKSALQASADIDRDRGAEPSQAQLQCLMCEYLSAVPIAFRS